MKRIVLTRLETSDQGTFGTIDVDGRTFHTGELPWRNNAANISCIPTGVYRVEMDPSPKYGMVYELREVPGREFILIHPGNYCGDASCGLKTNVNGCILLGLQRGKLAGQDAVLSSRDAVEQFEALMKGEPFELEIQDAPRGVLPAGAA